MPKTEILLSAKNVTREFGDVKALKGACLDVRSGKLVCLKGRSGSGKTTLLNILGALDKPTSGSVIFDGEEISALSEENLDKIRRMKIGTVFQSVALIGSMTALENVELALRLAGFPAKTRREQALKCLARVGLEKRAKHRPAELSGGEQQRVAIARAICHQPKLILADEPTAELDTVTGLAVMKLFRDLVKDEEYGHTIITTTHDEAMMELADEVYELQDGEIVNK